MNVTGEDTGLQAEFAVVDLVQRRVPVGEARQDDHRAEGFLAHHVGPLGHIFQQAGLEHIALAAATREQCRPGRDRVVDPALEPLGFLRRNHRADEGVALFGIARFERLHLGDEHVAETVVDFGVDDDALHMDAALPRLIIAAEDDASERMVEVGVLVDDHRGIAAEFEHDLFLARLCLEIPADARRAGEAEQFQPLVGGEEIGAVAACGQDAEGAFGQYVALGEHLAHDDRAQRRHRRGLHHEGAAHGDRRRDLVRRKVERKIERRDKAARADRHPLPHPHITLGARRNVERLDLAIIARRLFCGDAEGVDQAPDLALAVGDRLSRFHAQRIGKLVEAFLEARDAMIEDILPLVTREPRHRLGGAHRAGDGFIDDVGGRQRGTESDFAGEFVDHLEVGVRLHRLVVEIERVDVLEFHNHSPPCWRALRHPPLSSPRKRGPRGSMLSR